MLPTRALWLLGGWLALVIGLIGIFLPLLPTTPFVLLAAWCFSRGSPRVERWLLEHPRLGPLVRDWHEHRAVPLPAKQFATVMMTIGSIGALFLLPIPWSWLPAVACTGAGIILWRLPTRQAGRSG